MINRALLLVISAALISSCGIFFPSSLEGGDLADSELVDILFINEVSADHPEETDWIELYNSSSEAINLSGFYLSDDPSALVLWDFPNNTYIDAKSHMVITFNGNGGDFSTDFGLRAGEEGIYLTSPSDLAIIDSIATIPATGTGSYGRSTDGGEIWTVFLTPTKGGANQ